MKASANTCISLNNHIGSPCHFTLQNRGMIELEASLLPIKEADFAPVGKGREEPNRNPYLEPVTENRTYVDWKYIGDAVQSASSSIMASAKYGLIVTVSF